MMMVYMGGEVWTRAKLKRLLVKPSQIISVKKQLHEKKRNKDQYHMTDIQTVSQEM